MILVLTVYGVLFLFLGISYMIVSGKPAKPRVIKNRVKYDARVQRHRANYDRYHNVGERMWSSEISG